MDKTGLSQNIICRCCLELDSNDTFQSLSSELLNMFMACTTIKVSYDIGPWWICSSCVVQLSNCFEFQNRCKKSNELLMNKLALNNDSKKDEASTQSNVLDYEYKIEHEKSYERDDISSAKHIYQNLVNTLENKDVYCLSCRKIKKKVLAVRKHFERHECHCKRFSGREVRYKIKVKNGISTNQNGNGSLQIFPCPEDKYTSKVHIFKSEQDVNADDLHNIMNDATDKNLLSFKSEVDVLDSQYKCGAALAYDKNENDSIKLKVKTEFEESDKQIIDSHCELQPDYVNHDTDSEDDRPLKVIKKEIFNCMNCNKHFEDINTFQEHMYTHQWPLERNCDLCGKEFKTPRGLRLHKIIHADVRKFICDVCGKGFVFDYKLKQHSRTHTDEKLYACEHCGKMYKTMRILKIHYSTHASEKLFSCQNCGKRFRTEHNLKAHVKRCRGNKDFICNECGKAFVNKTELLIHTRAHTKEKPYACAHCHKAFRTQSHRAVHIRSHTGERPHECSECGKCFMIRRTLKIHMRIHSGELPYPCTVCSRRFRQPNVLKAHMKVHKILTFNNP